ncbi:MAG: DUF2237 domain-containing protein [Pseudomonadota bacterium]|nr:DUF2237 domain-containing protein [Pseudomonadota bacterium]
MKVLTDATNILGGKLQECCCLTNTGIFRDGFCHTNKYDYGIHSVCAKVTDEFLLFSKAQGNDLITPQPDYKFPGLKPGDKWCLCASRWLEAHQFERAPNIIAAATHIKTLEVIDLEILKPYFTD